MKLSKVALIDLPRLGYLALLWSLQSEQFVVISGQQIEQQKRGMSDKATTTKLTNVYIQYSYIKIYKMKRIRRCPAPFALLDKKARPLPSVYKFKHEGNNNIHV